MPLIRRKHLFFATKSTLPGHPSNTLHGASSQRQRVTTRNSIGSNPGRLPVCKACKNVFHRRSRHIDTSGAGPHGGCRVPSFAGRQIQHRPGGACETRQDTPGAGAAIPEAERILRRDRRRNSCVTRTGYLTLEPGPDLVRIGLFLFGALSFSELAAGKRYGNPDLTSCRSS